MSFHAFFLVRRTICLVLGAVPSPSASVVLACTVAVAAGDAVAQVSTSRRGPCFRKRTISKPSPLPRSRPSHVVIFLPPYVSLQHPSHHGNHALRPLRKERRRRSIVGAFDRSLTARNSGRVAALAESTPREAVEASVIRSEAKLLATQEVADRIQSERRVC